MADTSALLQALQNALGQIPGATPEPATKRAPKAKPDIDSDTGYRQLHAEIQIVSDAPAIDAFDRLREVYAISTAAHAEIYQAIKVLEQNRDKMPQGVLCDCVLAIRESVKKLKDTVSTLEHASEKIQDTVLIRYVADPESLEGNGQIYGNFCRGKPEYKARGKIPTFSKEPDRYNKMMDWLGVPEDLRDRGKELYEEGEFRTKVVDIDYLGLQDMLQKYAMNGIEIPDWLPPQEKFVEPCVTVWKLRDLI